MIEFWIYTVADGAFLREVLNAAAMVFNDGNYIGMLSVGALLGVLVIGFRALYTQKLDLHILLITFLVFGIMFSIKNTRVWVEDLNTGAVYSVDNVPIGIAAAGSIVSTVGMKATELFETAFSWPTMTGSGYMNTLEILLDSRGIEAGLANSSATKVGDVNQSVINYFVDCTNVAIDNNWKNVNDLMDASDTWLAAQFASDIYHTRTYLPNQVPEGVVMTCSAAHTAITNYLNGDFRTRWAEHVNYQLGLTNGTDPFAAGGDVQVALDTIVGAGSNAYTYMLNNYMSDLMYRAAQKDHLTYGDIGSALIVGEAMEKRNVQFTAEQSMWVRTMRPIMTFLESLIFAVTPLLVFFMMIGPWGIQLAMKYVMMLAWISLFKPIMAITNLYVQMSVEGEMSALEFDGTDAISQSGLVALHSQVADWVATGGMLAASTPVIALFLVSGSIYAASQMANRVQAKDTIDENKAAPDVASMSSAMQMGPANTWNATTGQMAGGADQIMNQMKLGEQMGSTISSLSSRSSTASEAQSNAYSNLYEQSNGWGTRHTDSASGSLSTTGRDSEMYSVMSGMSQKLSDNETLKGLNKDVLMSALGEGTNAGLKGGPIGAEVSQRLMTQYGMEETKAQEIGAAIEKTLKEDEGWKAELTTAVANDIKSGKSDDYMTGASDKDTANYTASYQEATQAQEAYSEASQLQKHLDSGFAGTMKQYAEKARRSNEGEGTGLAGMIMTEGSAEMRRDFQDRLDYYKNEEGFKGNTAQAEGQREEAAAFDVLRSHAGSNPELAARGFDKVTDSFGLPDGGGDITGSGSNAGINGPSGSVDTTPGAYGSATTQSTVGQEQVESNIASYDPESQYSSGVTNAREFLGEQKGEMVSAIADRFKQHQEENGYVGDNLAAEVVHMKDFAEQMYTNAARSAGLDVNSVKTGASTFADEMIKNVQEGQSFTDAVSNAWDQAGYAVTNERGEALDKQFSSDFASAKDAGLTDDQAYYYAAVRDYKADNEKSYAAALNPVAGFTAEYTKERALDEFFSKADEAVFKDVPELQHLSDEERQALRNFDASHDQVQQMASGREDYWAQKFDK